MELKLNKMDRYEFLKIEITSRRKGYQNYMDFIIDEKISRGVVFEETRVKIELLTELEEEIKRIENK